MNQVQGTRGSPGASPTPQTVNDAASQTLYGLLASSFTSYALTDADVLLDAQNQLAQQRNPGFRLNQVTVDLWTAQNNLWVQTSAVQIGSRIRITNLYAGAAPTGQLDVIAEGWTDTIGAGGYEIAFDTSPADNPPFAVFDDTISGRFGADSNTLNASIAANASSLAIATAGGKVTFTTSAPAYPMTILIGTEHITLNAAPSGSTSPQTFTGITRGVDGTTAAAQTAGAAVSVVQPVTFAF